MGTLGGLVGKSEIGTSIENCYADVNIIGNNTIAASASMIGASNFFDNYIPI